jgi:hypothetical protein
MYWAVTPAGWAAQAARVRAVRLLGRAVDSAQMPNSIKKFFSFFQIYFINYKSI